MKVNFLFIGCLLAALAVIVGAFGAHALKATLESTGKGEVFETAVRYHFYHAFALILVWFLQQKNKHNLLIYSGLLFLTGIFLFCGSLYILALTGFTKLGMVAPIGGLAFIVAWLICAKVAWKIQ